MEEEKFIALAASTDTPSLKPVPPTKNCPTLSAEIVYRSGDYVSITK
jgi:hypothetical protein